jgi:outer membrane protein OmpA-like peptidoglycan-associated protein
MTMRRILIACAVAALVASPPPAEAQGTPGSEEIIRKLEPQPRSRSLKPRGVKVEEGPNPEGPPSINLYINFEFNSDKLGTDAQIVLRNLGQALKDPRLAKFRFTIAGHTDAVGDAAYNQTLSERRAKAVQDYLVFHYGIDVQRLKSVGYGKTRLLDLARPNDGVNRRVQIVNEGEGS